MYGQGQMILTSIVINKLINDPDDALNSVEKKSY